MRAFGFGADDLDVPANYEPVRLKNILAFCNRGIAPSYVEEETSSVAVSQKCVYGGRVDATQGRYMDPTQAAPDAELIDGDVLISSTGRGTLGRVGIYASSPSSELADEKIFVADGHVTILRCRPAAVLPRYLNFLLGTREFDRFANEALAVGATNQIELNRERLRGVWVALPDLEIQEKLVRDLEMQCERVDRLVSEHLWQIELLREHREAAIVAAVSGEGFTEVPQ